MEPLETPVKDGVLYQQHIKFGKKCWRKVWGLLYAGGPSGVARLESWEVRDGGLGPAGDRSAGPGRRGERRIIRLADCVSVLPADGESCPRDTGAFLLTTTERSHLLAAEHRQAWMGPICQLAFPEVGEFPVVVQRTEAATRCQLKGPYLLRLGQDALQLSEPASPQVLYTWPYCFLRKFGADKGVFSFEAGRRCDSGEGLFAFSSARARDLCGALAAAIARQRERLPGPRPCPLPRATSLPSLEPPGELREGPPRPEAPGSRKISAAEPGPQSLPPLLGPAVSEEPPALLYASVCKRASGPPSAAAEHLYENLFAPDAGCRELVQEGPGGGSPPASPIYHNSQDLGWPGAAHDSSLEGQYRRLLELELADNGDEAAGSGRPGAHSGFKAKLVTLLSRERKKGPVPCDRP